MPIRRTRNSRSWKVSGDLNTVGQHQAYVDLTSKLYCVPKYSKPGNSSSQVAKQICRDRRECTRGYSDCVGLIKGVEGHQSRFESKKESSLNDNFLRPFRLDLVRENCRPASAFSNLPPSILQPRSTANMCPTPHPVNISLGALTVAYVLTYACIKYQPRLLCCKVHRTYTSSEIFTVVPSGGSCLVLLRSNTFVLIQQFVPEFPPEQTPTLSFIRKHDTWYQVASVNDALGRTRAHGRWRNEKCTQARRGQGRP